MGNLHRAVPFFLRRGPVGVLMIHGYTDCPFTLESLGKRLASEGGYTVRCDLLPGHGTDPAELNRVTWRDWWESVLHAYDALAAECTRVYVMGLSFGGTLALHLAQHREPAGLVTLAAMLGSVDPRPYQAHWLRHLMAFVPKTAGPDVSEALADYVGYDTVPVGGVAQVMQLIAHVSDDLAQVRCPMLIVHGQNDRTVPLENARTIHDTVASTDKELVILPRSCHVVTLDVEREILETRVLAWMSRMAEQARR